MECFINKINPKVLFIKIIVKKKNDYSEKTDLDLMLTSCRVFICRFFFFLVSVNSINSFVDVMYFFFFLFFF